MLIQIYLFFGIFQYWFPKAFIRWISIFDDNIRLLIINYYLWYNSKNIFFIWTKLHFAPSAYTTMTFWSIEEYPIPTGPYMFVYDHTAHKLNFSLYILGRVLILGIFVFLCYPMLKWFEIKKKNIPQVSSLYLNFNMYPTSMNVSHLNSMGFWHWTINFLFRPK